MLPLKFNKQFWQELWQLTRIYWLSAEKWQGYSLIILCILCAIIELKGNLAINRYLYKDFFNALQAYNSPLCIDALLHAAIALLVWISALALGLYLSGILAIRWQRHLNNWFLNRWTDSHRYYHLQLENRGENLDQRISEDCREFCTLSTMIFSRLLSSCTTIIGFGHLLWISSRTDLHSTWWLYHIPGYLLWCSLLYVVISTYLNSFIGRKLPTLNYQQEQFNANYRFGLMRLRENSEQIALAQGSKSEVYRLQNLFTVVYQNFLAINIVKRNLALFRNASEIIPFICGYVIQWPLYFSHRITFGELSQVGSGFSNVAMACYVLIALYAEFALWRAAIYRLSEFNSLLNEKVPKNIIFHSPIASTIKVENLRLFTPHYKLIVDNFNYTFLPSRHYQLLSAIGGGKSTLIRTLAGIWPYAEGLIEMPTNDTVFFTQNTPYLPSGSLRELLCYPQNPGHFSVSDEALAEILNLCQLHHLNLELDEALPWHQRLAMSEQQLIALCRILLQKPAWIFLDETTHALSDPLQEYYYQLIRQHLPSSTLICVDNRCHFSDKILL